MAETLSAPIIETGTEREALLERLQDPHYLPAFNELKETFSGQPEDWERFVRENPSVHEVLTQEYITELIHYLIAEREKILPHPGENDQIQIIEVGAGNGRLTHWLTQLLPEKEKEFFTFKAVDTQVPQSLEGQSAHVIKAEFPVENQDFKDALAEITHPTIVISSWMPPKQDWTTEFRAHDLVKNYILIGEPGRCGDKFKSWGERSEGYNEMEEGTPPYRRDFDRQELISCRPYQLSTVDRHFPQEKSWHHSKSETVSFTRK